MSKALERLNKIASKEQSKWLEEAKERASKSEWRDKSVKIAILVLREIQKQEETGMNQKKLAEQMGVSAQYINKVVKGQENLTLETISKLEKVLGIELFKVPDSPDEKPAHSKKKKTDMNKSNTKSASGKKYDYKTYGHHLSEDKEDYNSRESDE